jgi:hypothetical protein
MTREEVELRGMCPRNVVDVLDAISGARRISRTELVNAVLSEWADARMHEAVLIQRVVGFNPTPPDAEGNASERIRNIK